jgi:hypothetical protein
MGRPPSLGLTFHSYFVIFIANVTGVTKNWIAKASARRCPSRRTPHQYPRQSKAAGSGVRASLLRLVGSRLVVLLFARNLKHLGWEFSASIFYLFDERGQSWGHLLIDAIVISH